MRKQMVTRSFITTKCNVLCMDLVTSEPCNKEISLPRTFADDEKLLKAVRKELDTNELKAVHVVKKEEVETLYGMSETDFIKNAVELDPKTRREFATDGDKDGEIVEPKEEQ